MTTANDFADYLVHHYARFSRLDGCYVLNMDRIPCFDLDKLAAMMIAESADLASEVNGCDNPAFEKTMLPSLLSFFNNSSSKDEQIEFVDAWKKGVVSYLMPQIEDMLKEKVSEYNVERDHIGREDPGCKRWFGDKALCA